MAQIVDGINQMATGTESKTSEVLQGSDNLIGLMASGSENHDLINAGGNLLPGMMTGGNIKAILDAPAALKSSENAAQATFNALNATDAVLDVKGVIDAVIDRRNSSDSSSGSGSSGQVIWTDETVSQDKVDKIRSFVN